MIVIDINPRVREILDAAVAASKPIWVGLFDPQGAEPVARQSTYMEPDCHGTYSNINQLMWGIARPLTLEGTVVCLRSTGPWADRASFTTPHPPIHVGPGDSLAILPGGLRLGRLP